MTLYRKRDVPFELYEINILNATQKELVQISQELGIGLNLKEMQAVQRYFKKLNRNPTDVELQTIGQTWSEHCYHKTFKGKIKTPKKEIESLFKTYIFKTAKKLKPSWCISVFEDNAGIIEFEKNYAIAVKVETHNHPSAIEPFGGAATGVGGVIRDILGVWADPIACTDVLCFGPLNYEYEKLPAGVKHPKYLFQGVIAGIGCYGNNMGIPTVNGAIYFDEGYLGNIVVYCGCVGVLPIDKYVKNVKPKDIAILAGGRTGRDGIHGVTFASAELTEKSEETSRPAVQIANPIEEEKLKRAILKVRDKKLCSAITDLGGGGLSSAICETANRFKLGAYVELDKVPLKYSPMAPWEIFISESQERMLIVAPKKNLKKVLEIFASEEVEAAPIGVFTEKQTFQAVFQKITVAEIDIPFLFQPPKTIRKAKWITKTQKEPKFSEPVNLTHVLFKLLSSPNIASKEHVIRTYDHEVKGNTVIKPLQGDYAGPNDAAILKPLADSWKGIVISCGINPKYGKINSYWMAASAIDEAIRNNVAVGGRRIALLDNFTWGNPEKPDRMGSLLKACEACYKFAKGFGTPFISGKDSLYNESPLGPVTPTLLITAVGVISDIRNAVSLDLKKQGNPIYIIGKTYKELGGSEYYSLQGFLGNTVPKVRMPQAKKVVEYITKAIDLGLVKACHDISEGGLACAAAEMALSSPHGIKVFLKKIPRSENINRNDFILFSESNSRFLIEVEKQKQGKIEALMRKNNVPYALIGEVTKNPKLVVYGLNNKIIIEVATEDLRKHWKSLARGEK
jgi:phosphoribosylformylglycinamidine synthase